MREGLERKKKKDKSCGEEEGGCACFVESQCAAEANC